jgi:hypothetical protein
MQTPVPSHSPKEHGTPAGSGGFSQAPLLQLPAVHSFPSSQALQPLVCVSVFVTM